MLSALTGLMPMNSTHFSDEELRCKCGCGLNNATHELLELAEACRAILNVPRIIGKDKNGHSVCRCEKHNTEVGGVPNSYHVQGKAMDFHAKGIPHQTVFNELKRWAGQKRLPLLGGIGLYDWGIHIDVGKSEDGHLRTWDERKK